MPSLFIKKLYLMINECNDNIEWIGDTKFIIHNPNKLTKNMVGIFNNTKTESFLRQLSIYGFKKVGGTKTRKWVYSRKFFTRDGSMLDQINRNINIDNSNILLKINEINEIHNKRYKELEDIIKNQNIKIEYLTQELLRLKNNMFINPNNQLLYSNNLILNPDLL